jgi:AcrR family transcriptional regulator
MSRPSTFGKPLKLAIAELVKSGKTITEVARRLGISRQAIYYHFDKDDGFLDAVDDARELACDLVEHALLRSALGCEVTESRTIHSEKGTVTVSVKKQLPPNPKACEIWLSRMRAIDWTNTPPRSNGELSYETPESLDRA